MEFRLLGALEVVQNSTPIDLGGAREQALLGALLLRANKPASVRYLVEAAWDRPLASPNTNLRSYVSRLRRRLSALPDGDGRLLTRSGGYLLVIRPGELDADVFEGLLDDAEQALATGDLRRATTILLRAVELWRGEPLEGTRPGPGLRPELTRLCERRSRALEQYHDTRIRLGEHAAVADDLHRLVAEHPLREEIWALLMLALYRSGRRAEALDSYMRARTHLTEALGITPGPRLQQLHAAMLRDDPGLAPQQAATPPAVGTPRPTQLPADVPEFTGRDDDLARLLALPRSNTAPAAVIGTIDGMAGVGKTALAVHAAHLLAEHYPDGQLFLDLHGHTQGIEPLSAAQALDHCLRGLGVPDEHIPRDTQARVALYRSHLANRRMLLLLDNVRNENQVLPLLPAAPECLVLVTSRRRLIDIDGAYLSTLDVLSLPDAVTLFTGMTAPGVHDERAGELITEIVELCGRLPLAICIAAARLRHRPAWRLADLAARLSDQQRLSELETSRRSVAAAIDLSYQQLEPAQQRMFRLLGLNPGSDIGASAAAALTGTTPKQAGRILEELLDTHLLQQHRPGRYHFHDLTRAHAAASSVAQETEAQRHAAFTQLLEYYTDTASAATELLYPQMAGTRREPLEVAAFTNESQAVSWLDTELANVLAAAASHSPEHTLRLSATMHDHLRTRARYLEAETLHTHALRIARRTGDQHAELYSLNCLGHVHRMQNRQDLAIFEQALELARKIGEAKGELYALYGLGIAHRVHGRYLAALDCYEKSLDLARRVGDPTAELRALYGLGSIHRIQGRHPLALHQFAKALEVARDIGDRVGEINALTGIAVVQRAQRAYAKAGDRFEEALIIARETGHRSGEMYALIGLGTIHRALKSYESAIDWGRQALRAAEEIGDRNAQLEALIGRGYVYLATDQPALALADHDKARELTTTLEQPEDLVRVLHGLACAHEALGEVELAREHWSHALARLDELDLTAVEEVDIDDIRTRLARLNRTAHNTSGAQLPAPAHRHGPPP